jgi:hypothetical protein
MTTDLTQDMHRKHLLSFGNNYQNLETKPTLALDFRIASNNCLRQIEKQNRS